MAHMKIDFRIFRVKNHWVGFRGDFNIILLKCKQKIICKKGWTLILKFSEKSK